MSRTFRNKYTPHIHKYEFELVKFSRFYMMSGHCPLGYRWFTTNWDHKAGLDVIRVLNSRGRDGTKAHGNTKHIINNAVKMIDSRVRIKMKQELKRMRSGNLDWDEHYENHNKIRMAERGYIYYEF